jgi:type I restriction enzyme S subunit
MRDGRIDFQQARRISQSTFEEWTRRLKPRVGDILFAREAPVGPLVQVPAEENVAPGQRTVLLRPDPARIDPRYLFYLLGAPSTQARLREKAEGSTVPHLNVADIRTFVLPGLPPIAEQRGISATLRALDEKIDSSGRMLAIAHALFMAIYTQLIRDESAPLWEEVALADVVSTQYGLTASARADRSGPRFLRVMDINKDDWVDWDAVPGCDISTGDVEKYRLNPGDLVVARMADPGKAAIYDDDSVSAVFASYLVRLVPPDYETGLFLFGFLKSPAFVEYARASASGSVQKNMNAKVIVGARMRLPPPGRLDEFGARVTPLRHLINQTQRESTALGRLRDALLPELLAGRVRVPEAREAAKSAI